MTMLRRLSVWLTSISLTCLLTTGCPVAGDDDDSGEDAPEAPGDDDTTATPTYTAEPPHGATLSWSDCIAIDWLEDVVDVTAVATVDGSDPFVPFAAHHGDAAWIQPIRPWPPGSTVAVQVDWAGGSLSLEYRVEDLVPSDPDPTGAAGAVDLVWGERCPPLPQTIDFVGENTVYGLVEALGGGTQLDVRVGYSLSDEVTQDLCIETATIQATYADPLLVLDDVGAAFPPGAEVLPRQQWLAMQLGPDGQTPAGAASGAVFLSSDLDSVMQQMDDRMGQDFCAFIDAVGMHHCGACPDDLSERCYYQYLIVGDVAEPAGPVAPRSSEEIAADPSCP